jgi:hypothetical protein
VDYQLLFEKQVLGDDSAATAWPNQLGEGSKQCKSK